MQSGFRDLRARGKLLVEMRFGSHLYGTASVQSDIDLKAVYLPDPEDILLQRVKPALTSSRERVSGEKNTAGDIDREAYSLQRYLELLAEGQTVAIDMLFAPDDTMIFPPTPLWRDIQSNAHRLVSRRASAFLRYCRAQANKYGIRGSRVAASRRALELLSSAEERLGTTDKVERLASELDQLTSLEHVSLVDLPTPSGRLVRHLEICGRKVPFTASIKTAREVAQRLMDEYGQRALQAERNEGVDWKALSHAVRVGREALELFSTGRIVFPLRYADHIRHIKNGEISYDAVATEIEDLLGEVERAAEASLLPESPDQAFIDNFVARAYREQIVRNDP